MSTSAVSMANVDVVMRVDEGEGKDGREDEEYDDVGVGVWRGCSSVSQLVSAASTVMQAEQDGVEA